MRYKVLLTGGAERDLEDLYGYIAESDSPDSADYVLDALTKVAQSLSTFPERGSHRRELLALGIREYRQSFFRSHRVIYRVPSRGIEIIRKQVIIYVIADGRRDMQSLLARRLLGA